MVIAKTDSFIHDVIPALTMKYGSTNQDLEQICKILSAPKACLHQRDISSSEMARFCIPVHVHTCLQTAVHIPAHGESKTMGATYFLTCLSRIAGMSQNGLGTSSSMESSGGLSDLQQQQQHPPPPRQQPLFHPQHFLNGDVVRSSSPSVTGRGGVGTFAMGQVIQSTIN